MTTAFYVPIESLSEKPELPKPLLGTDDPSSDEPWSDEPEMESSAHSSQLMILVASLEWLWRDRTDFFIGANLSIYYTEEDTKKRRLRGPDFFVAVGTEKRKRRSWLVRKEGKYPDLIIELLSSSTARQDRTTKKKIYQNRFRTPEYFWFSPDTMEFKGWKLVDDEYEEILPDSRGLCWSTVLGLHLGIEDQQLRYFAADGELIPLPEEVAEKELRHAERERQRAERERQRAERETQRAERLAAQLRALGIEPEA